MICLFLFFFVIKFAGDNGSLIDFIKNESNFIGAITLASLVFGIILFVLREREKNLEWQEELRDKKREERKKRGEDEPYEGYF